MNARRLDVNFRNHNTPSMHLAGVLTPAPEGDRSPAGRPRVTADVDNTVLRRLPGRSIPRLLARDIAWCTRGCNCGGACAGQPHADEELLEAGGRALSRAVAARAADSAPAAIPTALPESVGGLRATERRGLSPRERPASQVVARIPSFRPRPAWSWSCSSQLPPACEPLSIADNPWAFWSLWSRAWTYFAVDRVDCKADAQTVWDAYFSATGSPSFVWSEARDPGSCVIRSLKADPDHLPFEQPIINAVVASIPALVPRLRGTAVLRLPLVDAGVTPAVLGPPPGGCGGGSPPTPRCLALNHNRRVGGQFFGGVGQAEPGAPHGQCGSEYGPDTREVDGVVVLTKRVDPTDPCRILVEPSIELHWHITDAVDFCPGNTIDWCATRPLSDPCWLLRGPVVSVSRLEASGMARDIRVEADYTRVRTVAPQGPFPTPDPVPPRVVTIPAHALFGFDRDTLTPRARAELLATLGDAPLHADPAQPVEVNGHTDSVGAPEYNQRLSERRALAVKRILEEEYPNLSAPGRVVAVGFGETQPVAPNTTEAGRRENRRVEIVLRRGEAVICP